MCVIDLWAHTWFILGFGLKTGYDRFPSSKVKSGNESCVLLSISCIYMLVLKLL